jgi:hypothetical protein
VINQDLFLDGLKYFLKFKSESRVLLILDDHGNHTSYEAITFRKDHDIGLVSPPHRTHVLQPLDRACFKPIKAQCHKKKAMELMHRNAIEAISKVRFTSLFAEAHNKTPTMGETVRGFMFIRIVPLQRRRHS